MLPDMLVVMGVGAKTLGGRGEGIWVLDSYPSGNFEFYIDFRAV